MEVEQELKKEIQGLKDQLDKASEGLRAANRLGDQLEQKSRTINNLKQDLKLREDLLKKAQHELDNLTSNSVAKVDRYLVKNLIVGYLVADASKRPEVMKVVATVLDFNQDERDKIGLSSHGSSWLSGWFGSPPPGGAQAAAKPTHSRSSSDVQAATGLDQSLVQAFVQFLETESKPKKVLQLPIGDLSSPSRGSESRRSSTPAQDLPVNNPILNHGDLPTFNPNRSSSAILKNVLHSDMKTSTPKSDKNGDNP